jgi:hypothetical protein
MRQRVALQPRQQCENNAARDRCRDRDDETEPTLFIVLFSR